MCFLSPRQQARPFVDRLAGRVDGASLAVFRIAFGVVGLVSADPAGGPRLGHHALRRAVAALHLPRLRLGAQAVRGGDAGPARRRGGGGRAGRCGVLVPARDRRLLRGVHLDRADRRHDVPQPLLVREPGGAAPVLPARRRLPVGRRLAARRADRAPWRGVPAAGPGRRGVRLRRSGQAERRLAVAGPALAPLAPRQGRPGTSSTACSTSAGSPTPSPSAARCSTAPWFPCSSGGGLGPSPSRPS